MGIRVFFIGGFRATLNDIDSWTGSAAAQRPDVRFEGFPWPAAAWHVASDDEHVVKVVRGAGALDKTIKTVAAAKDDVVFIVGHSSGCAIANAVDEGLNTSNTNLISLDGYRPNTAQRQRTSTQMWSARNGKNVSRNFPKKGDLGGRLKVWTGQSCTNEWSLHFSVVNTATSDATVTGGSDAIKNGYQGCRANLCWLGPSL